MHQKCEKKFTKILLCLFSSVAKIFDNKGDSFWVFYSTTVTHNSKPGIIFYCRIGDWMPNLANLVHKDLFIKNQSRTVVKLLLFNFDFLWISLEQIKVLSFSKCFLQFPMDNIHWYLQLKVQPNCVNWGLCKARF